MVHAHDDGAGTQEQQGLEESVRHEVKHGHRVSRGAQGHSHVAQLRQGGISHYALDVVLDDAQEAHEQGRDGTNHHDEVQSSFRQLEQRRHAGHHENSCSDHGSRVNQGRDRCRAFHRVWQPHVQRELRRFAHGANEQANANDSDQHPRSARQCEGTQVGSFGKCFCVVQGARISGNEANAQNKSEVTHTVDQEGFHVGKNGGRFVEPKANQQIRHQTHSFPAKEQLQHVVAHDQHQHGESEQRDVGKETVVAFVFFHVANGVDVNHERDKGDDAHHHGREAIDHEAHFHAQTAHGHPGIKGFIEASTINGHTLQSRG